MSNLLKTEIYKLFHSWYFWGIGILYNDAIIKFEEHSLLSNSNMLLKRRLNIPIPQKYQL